MRIALCILLAYVINHKEATTRLQISAGCQRRIHSILPASGCRLSMQSNAIKQTQTRPSYRPPSPDPSLRLCWTPPL